MPVNDTSMPAPSATEPFVDRYRRVTPKWYPWVKRMIDSLRQTVLTVNTIETQVGTIDVTVDQLVTDLNSAELTIAALEDTTVAQGISIANTITLANGTASDVTDLEGDVAGISAQWAVTINGNGQVIGLAKLDGSATGSTFSVVADKFLVAHPEAPGMTITAFVVGMVDGVSTVGINGNVLVDGSILARHISVPSLDAISASFGNAAFEDSAYSVTEVGGEPALTIDFSTPRIRMLSTV